MGGAHPPVLHSTIQLPLPEFIRAPLPLNRRPGGLDLLQQVYFYPVLVQLGLQVFYISDLRFRERFTCPGIWEDLQWEQRLTYSRRSVSRYVRAGVG